MKIKSYLLPKYRITYLNKKYKQETRIVNGTEIAEAFLNACEMSGYIVISVLQFMEVVND